MSPAELLAQSLAALRNANRIDGARASYRKDNPVEYTLVLAYLDGGPRPGGTLSLMGQGLVLEEDARRALVSLPPPGRAFEHVSDFSYTFNQGPFPDGGGIYEVAGGLRFVVTEQMPTSWEPASKIAQCVWNPLPTDFVGKTHAWTWVQRVPSAGNPDGMPQAWQSGILVEFGTTGPPASVGQHLAIHQDRRWRVGVEKAPGNSWDFIYGPTIPYDTDLPVRLDIKWSYGPDGFCKWTLGGVVVVDRQGPTLFGEGSYVRVVGVGMYGAREKHNEVHFLDMNLAG